MNLLLIILFEIVTINNKKDWLTNCRHDSPNKVECSRIVPPWSFMYNSRSWCISIFPQEYLYIFWVHCSIVLGHEVSVDLPVPLPVHHFVFVFQPLEKSSSSCHVHKHHKPEQKKTGIVFVEMQQMAATLPSLFRVRVLVRTIARKSPSYPHLYRNIRQDIGSKWNNHWNTVSLLNTEYKEETFWIIKTWVDWREAVHIIYTTMFSCCTENPNISFWS